MEILFCQKATSKSRSHLLLEKIRNLIRKLKIPNQKKLKRNVNDIAVVNENIPSFDISFIVLLPLK